MKMDRLRDECSIKGKNGIAFLLAATILWLCFVIVYLQPFDLRFKNVIVLMMTALLFPLSWGISMMIKAEWLQKKHPFSELGLILNYAQLAYLPLVIWAFLQMPEKMIAMFAVITGAHLFPYGWFYRARGYYVMAFVIAISMMMMGWVVSPVQLWIIPIVMAFFLIILILWLWVDYKKKSASVSFDD